MRRLPSVPRDSWMMVFSDRAMVWRISVSDIWMPPMPTIASTRDRASRGVLACTVVIDPSWPVFIACSMSSTSPPRHSPMMMRSGRIRRAFFTRSRATTSPLPSMFGGPRLQAHHVPLLQLQLGGVLDGHDPLARRG